MEPAKDRPDDVSRDLIRRGVGHPSRNEAGRGSGRLANPTITPTNWIGGYKPGWRGPRTGQKNAIELPGPTQSPADAAMEPAQDRLDDAQAKAGPIAAPYCTPQ